MDKLQNDLNFGYACEKSLLKNIKDRFGCDIRKIEENYSLFDYTNDKNIFIELKSRRVSKNQYPTTMVGYNKIKMCEKNPTNTYFFVFNFTDGAYFWEYKPDIALIDKGGRCDRGRSEIKNYAFIPVDVLSEL